MKIVTGYRGTPHISSADQQAFNQGVIGNDNYVLSVGNCFAASIEDVNTVQVIDGDGVIQGVHFRIEPGDFENVNIENGTIGVSRIDLIVARYQKNSTTGIESVELVVIKGEDAESDPVIPAYHSGRILDGDSPVDYPLYKVTINELTPSLTALFGVQDQLSTIKPLWVNMGTVSNLPVTKNAAMITADMICTAYELGTPSAQTGDWSVVTASGSVTISGTISRSTTLKIKLEKVTNVS